MEKFIKLTGIAAPLPITNVDTDMIIPKQFLTTIERKGLAKGLFYEMRYDQNGKKIDNFILHNPAYSKAQILIAGDNFGCGSSREHAPWALLDYGFRCVISSSFADIFYNNCFKNGILPIVLPKENAEALLKDVTDNPGAEITIDLEQQTITRGNKHIFKFDIDPFRKHCLMHALDDIGMTLEKSSHIDDFERTLQSQKPWLIKASS